MVLQARLEVGQQIPKNRKSIAVKVLNIISDEFKNRREPLYHWLPSVSSKFILFLIQLNQVTVRISKVNLCDFIKANLFVELDFFIR